MRLVEYPSASFPLSPLCLSLSPSQRFHLLFKGSIDMLCWAYGSSLLSPWAWAVDSPPLSWFCESGRKSCLEYCRAKGRETSMILHRTRTTMCLSSVYPYPDLGLRVRVFLFSGRNEEMGGDRIGTVLQIEISAR